MFDRLSIELTNQCSKGCVFCYNDSRPTGRTEWEAGELIAFVKDCAKHGIHAVSFGGGEPLEFANLAAVLTELRGVLFRSVTTNGLWLDKGLLAPLVEARPDKVHVSIHFPQNRLEVERVLRQVKALEQHAIPAGVNLLVSRSQLAAAATAALRLQEAGISSEQIVLLPMRGADTPTPAEVAQVAREGRFQSMSCLLECGPSRRFCSVGWDKSVGWCSYTASRRKLSSLTFSGLREAMDGIGLNPCVGAIVPLLPPKSPSSAKPSPMMPSDANVAEPELSYPAAHSMDTVWFAFDGQGQVAMFESGEGGAVPRAFLGDKGEELEQYVDVFAEILLPSYDNRVQWDLSEFFSGGAGRVYRDTEWNERPDLPLTSRLTTFDALFEGLKPIAVKRSFFERVIGKRDQQWELQDRSVNAVCWLAHDGAIEKLPKASVVIPAGNKSVAWAPDCSLILLRRLFEEGEIFSLMLEDFEPSLQQFGFFIYSNDDYESGPYEQTGVPRTPLTLDQLPAESRDFCSRVEYASINFAEAPRLQPAEHGPCEAWTNDWVDLNGKTHVFVKDPTKGTSGERKEEA